MFSDTPVEIDAFAVGQDSLAPAEIDISRGQVVQALVPEAMVVVFAESFALHLEVAEQMVAFEQSGSSGSGASARSCPVSGVTAPADDLGGGEVGLPELVGRVGLAVEFLGCLDHDVRWAGDQVMRLEQAIDRVFGDEVTLMVSEVP
jgi:hypothetical protein